MPLSKTAQTRLMSALDEVATLITSGEHPNDAIVKAASTTQIPAGHIHLMVNAVNTGATNAHRMAHETTLEKSSEFPLANTDKILSEIYPDHVKTKKAHQQSSVISTDYSSSPNWLHDQAKREKLSRDINWSMTDKKVNYIKEDKSVKAAYSKTIKMKKDVATKKLDVAELEDIATKIGSELREYFKQTNSYNYNTVKSNAVLMFGKQAEAILLPMVPKKQLVFSDEGSHNNEVRPYSLIQSLIKLAEEYKTKVAAYNNAVKATNEEAAKLMLPFGAGPKQGLSVLEDRLSTIEKNSGLGGFLTGAMGIMNARNLGSNIAGSYPGLRPTDSLERGTFNDLTDPGHESEIRNIQSEALLNDLMANDDVIQGYDPEEVVDAFNEVSQIAPFAANKKVIMRDLMRKRLAGGSQALDQFTTSETLKQQDMLKGLNTLPERSNPYSQSVMKDLGYGSSSSK